MDDDLEGECVGLAAAGLSRTILFSPRINIAVHNSELVLTIPNWNRRGHNTSYMPNRRLSKK